MQAVVRGHQAKQRNAALRQATLMLQSKWRGRQARLLVSRIRACIRLQAAFRGFSIRTHLTRQHRAAVRVQSAWRGHKQHRAYCQYRHGVTSIQSAARRYLARKQYHAIRAAAVVMQARWRAVKAGQKQRQLLQHWHTSAVHIQAHWRGVHQRTVYMHMRQSAVRIQAAVRRALTRHHYVALKHAAAVIQSRYRALHSGRRVRQEAATQQAAAVMLQSAWRCYQQRSLYLSQRSAAITLQAAARRHTARKRYVELRSACLVIQLRCAALKAGQAARLHIKQQHAAAVRIQANWKCHKQRISFMRVLSHVILVQSLVRKHLARTHFLKLRSASLVVQSRWAALKAGKAVRLHIQGQHAAATCIQAIWRGHRQRASFHRDVACVVALQAAWRRFAARRAYQHVLRAAVQIQTAVRAQQARLLLKRIKVNFTIKQKLALVQILRLNPHCPGIDSVCAVLNQCCKRQPQAFMRQYHAPTDQDIMAYN